jgi:hypothetical protein
MDDLKEMLEEMRWNHKSGLHINGLRILHPLALFLFLFPFGL